MRFFVPAAVLALVTSGCASTPDEGDIYWSAPGASEGQLADLQKACSLWNPVASRQQYVAESGAGTHLVRFVPRSEIPLEPRPRGLYDPDSHTLYVATGPDEDERQFLAVVHEQGHALGLDHTARVGVMNAYGLPADAEVALTQGDLDECRRVRACP